MVISAETIAWIVLVVSAFYLLDRLTLWLVGRAVENYRARRRSGGAGVRRDRSGPT